jgi:branched-chain amino acid transport system ATP-binding protein
MWSETAIVLFPVFVPGGGPKVLAVFKECNMVLEISQLKVAYGGMDILKDVSLNLESGEVAALLGPNGAGKSTLLKAIMKIGGAKVTDGYVSLAGQNINRFKTAQLIRKGIVYFPQGNTVFPNLSVKENLEIALKVVGVAAQEGLDSIYGRYPVLAQKRRQAAGSLSGGERQILALARALACKPKVLLLDEPTIGLSPLLAREALENLVNLKEEGISVLLVEQRVKEALAVSDRSYLLKAGRVLMEGKGSDLKDSDILYQAYLA